MFFGTCVLVGVVLASPERTTAYYATVPFGNIAHYDLRVELSKLANAPIWEVKELTRLPLRKESPEDCREYQLADLGRLQVW